jgi:hypothetical protein
MNKSLIITLTIIVVSIYGAQSYFADAYCTAQANQFRETFDAAYATCKDYRLWLNAFYG